MAAERLRAILDAVWAGGQATAKASAAIAGVGKSSDETKKRLETLKGGLETAGKAFGVLVGGTKLAWETLERGAALDLSRSRFDRLTASIGSTADVMLTRLREATRGMMSDAELMASASQIISLGLMDTEDGVIRLATVVGELGWDMNQVILTFANNSKMRLDALGLSISDVDERTKKFVAAGHSIDDAFDMAVLEAGEDRILAIGSAAGTAAGDLKVLRADLANVKDGLLEMMAVRAAPAIHLLAGGYEEDLRRMMEAEVAAAQSTEDFIAILKALDDQSSNMFKLGGGNVVREYTDILVGELARASTGVDDFKAKLQAAGLVIATEYGREIVILNNRHVALEVLLKNATTAQALNAAAIEESRRVVQEYNKETAQAVTQIGLMEAGERGMTYTTQRAVSAGKAQAEALAAEAEALRVAEEAARALRVEYAGEFMTALNMADGETVNFTNTMLTAAAQGGANAETLALLAAATGEYSDEQIRAALETAAMTQKAQELGAAIAEGNITVGEALLQFQDFRAELEQAIVPEVDWSDIAAAHEHTNKLLQDLIAINGFQASAHVNVTYATTGSMDFTDPGRIGGPRAAAGGVVTGGIPGRDSVPIMAMPGEVILPTSVTTAYPGGPEMLFRDLMRGGEMFNVVPHGQAAGGGGDTYNYYIYPTYASPTNEASLEADIRAMELLRA